MGKLRQTARNTIYKLEKRRISPDTGSEEEVDLIYNLLQGRTKDSYYQGFFT